MPDIDQSELATKFLVEVFKEGLKAAIGGVSKAKRSLVKLDPFQTAFKKYLHRLEERYNTIRIIGMDSPIPLRSIYVRLNVLTKPTALRRYTIDRLVSDYNTTRRVFTPQVDAKDAISVIEKIDNVMVLGKPGAGKTTFLKQIALQAADGKLKQHRIPIFINLRNLSETDKSLNDAILDELSVCGFSPQQANHFLEKLLDNKGCLLILDGLDETGAAFERIVKEVNNFTARYEGNHFIISCRVAYYNYVFEHFRDVELADFDDDQIKTFIERWFSSQPVTAHACLKQLDHQDNLPVKELCRSPLLLTLLCLAYAETLEILPSRGELYREGIDALLKRWDVSRGVKRLNPYGRLGLKEKENMLCQIAEFFFRDDRIFFKKAELEQKIEAYIQNFEGERAQGEAWDAETILTSIEAQHGLLVERARGLHSFSHLTFQEYFTAKHIINYQDAGSLKRLVRHHAFDRRWREVVLLVAELLPDAGQFLFQIQEQLFKLTKNNELKVFLDRVFLNVRSGSSYKLAAARSLAVWWVRTYQLEIDTSVEQIRIKQHLEDLFLAQKLDEKVANHFSLEELDSHPARITLLAQNLLNLDDLNILSDDLIQIDQLSNDLENYMYGQRLIATLLGSSCYVSKTMRKTLSDGLMETRGS
jgi:hypothetical protein